MNLFAFFLFSFIVASWGEPSRDKNNKPFKVVCYLGTWANYRTGDGKFVIEDIDANICTHIIYGFVKIEGGKIASLDPYLDLKDNWGLDGYGRFNALKKQNPHLTTLIAIGGWTEGSEKYSQMASTPESRKIFVDSVVEFLDGQDFDGFDVDWEYPANRGGQPQDKANYILLLKELKEALQPKGYLLSAAVAAGKTTIDSAYDIPGMAKYLDFINVMAYDLHGSWESYTHHNAPLYSRPDDSEGDKLNTVSYSIDYWISQGADPKQVILGLPIYGRGFQLASSATGVRAPTKGPNAMGPITKEMGYLGYIEICKSLKSEKWDVNWVEEWKAPYMVKGDQWVGFDNKQSIIEKVKYAKEKNLGGAMVWSLETDDFKGICGDGKYPLTSQMDKILNGQDVVIATTNKPTCKPTDIPNPSPRPTQRPEPNVTEKPVVTSLPTITKSPSYQCQSAGFQRDPTDCNKFFNCVTESGPIYTFACGDNLHFHSTMHICMRPEDADCNL